MPNIVQHLYNVAPKNRRTKTEFKRRRWLYFQDKLFGHYKKSRQMFYMRMTKYPAFPDSSKNVAYGFRFPGFWPGVYVSCEGVLLPVFIFCVCSTTEQSSVAAMQKSAKSNDGDQKQWYEI